MNRYPTSREGLEQGGFVFQRRTTCKAEPCGAQIEWWQSPSGRWTPFRLHPRSGELIYHTEECPGRKQVETKPELPAPKEPKLVKVKAEPVPQGRLF